jgi:WD40 repeat protein
MKIPLVCAALALLSTQGSPLWAGDKAGMALKELLRRAGDETKAESTRLDLLNWRRDFPGHAMGAQAVDAIAKLPSPPDRLKAEAIPEDERKFLSVPGMVAFFRAHNRSVASVGFSPDGKLLATSSWDNKVKLYQLGGDEPKEWATLEGSPSSIAFSPDGKSLATGTLDSRVVIWDLTGAKPRQQHAIAGHKNRPFAMTFSPSGKMLASGCYDPVLRLWKFDDAEPDAWAALANEVAPAFGIFSLAYSHDGRYLVAGNYVGKQTLRIWDVLGNYLEELDVPATKARLVACSPVDAVMATAAEDAPIRLWTIAGGKAEPTRTLAGHQGKGTPPAVKALAFAPNGQTLASAGQDRKLILWNVADGKAARHWDLLDEVRALAYSSDGRHLAVGNDDGTLYILRLESAK